MSLMNKQKNDKPDTSHWDDLHGKIRTKKGGWVIGEAVYNHGYSMLDDLVGKDSYFQVLFLNVTGRRPERRLADWLEALFICLSWPDSRIWCNQVGSLAGTMQSSPVAAVSAGILASDARMYGPGVVLSGTRFIQEARLQQKQGKTASDIVEEYLGKNRGNLPVIPGYVRPIANGDERVEAMERVTEALGFQKGKHLSLAFAIQVVMLEKYQEGMNVLGYAVAFLCDQRLSSKEIHRLLAGWVSSGVHGCYAEAADNPPESFFPLRCDDMDYQGPPPRPVPPSEG